MAPITAFALAIGLLTPVSWATPSVFNYGSPGCEDRHLSGCSDLAENSCCNFLDTEYSNGIRTVWPTFSVKWLNLENCDIGNWHFPRLSGNSVDPGCGRVRANAVGPARVACLSSQGNALRRDGAMWSVILRMSLQCIALIPS